MSWRDNLLPASFRGIPFQVLSHERVGGRRVQTTEYPYRDDPQNEDLGRLKRSYTVKAYVLGDDYMQARDDLIAACEVKSGPGPLVHPWLGELLVVCETVTLTETVADGRMAVFELKFTEESEDEDENPQKSPYEAGFALDQVAQALSAARQAFAVAVLIATNPDFLRNAVLSGLNGMVERLAGTFLGLPGLDLALIEGAITALAAVDPADDAATARAITNAHIAVSRTAEPVPVALPRGVASGSRGVEPSRASFQARAQQLLALSYSLTATPDASAQAALAQVTALGNDAATLAAAESSLFATYDVADEVEATRLAVVAALMARRDAAAERGADDLYRVLLATLAAVSAELLARSASLPRLARYTVAAPLPSLALAQRLYAAPTRADGLVALNDAPHPAFMPVAGVALRG